LSFAIAKRLFAVLSSVGNESSPKSDKSNGLYVVRRSESLWSVVSRADVITVATVKDSELDPRSRLRFYRDEEARATIGGVSR